eukprot:3066376-Amphidinium_carterae.1
MDASSGLPRQKRGQQIRSSQCGNFMKLDVESGDSGQQQSGALMLVMQSIQSVDPYACKCCAMKPQGIVACSASNQGTLLPTVLEMSVEDGR